MLRFALIAAALTAAPAFAQDQQAQTGHPPDRIRDVTVNRGQRCPPSTDQEVVVCHVLDEPYRIPKALRDEGPIPAANQSWVNRAATIDQVSRTGGGVLPDTCSAVGLAGQSGCALQSNQQWAAERRAADASSAAVESTAAAAAHPSGTAQ